MTKTITTVKTPLFAAVGAGDIAAESLGGIVKDARRAAGSRASDVQARIDRARGRVVALQEQVPSELAGLRGRVGSAELRKQADAYLQSARTAYGTLAQRGESRVERLREQALAEERVVGAVSAVSRRATEVRALVNRFGAKASDATIQVASAAGVLADETKETLAAVPEVVADEAAAARESAEAAAEEVVAKVEDAVADAEQNVAKAEAKATEAAGSADSAAATAPKAAPRRRRATSKPAGTTATTSRARKPQASAAEGKAASAKAASSKAESAE
ncbi:hypothetical protein [Lolliginicoccus suaedae]|uniref:hypothetical protein n=1 Tax=Lolliginicoccus suaedae TaxID=2605429 RepID=UPI0011F06968|nr:hypothetical protein [Lolliginicoccus suaedae]